MPYAQPLDDEISAVVRKDAMVRKKMFGGTCYMWKDRMVCGVWRDFLILKLGEAAAMRAIREGEGQVFDITGKAMKAWIMVPESKLGPGAVEGWIERAK